VKTVHRLVVKKDHANMVAALANQAQVLLM
jgi:hypothetical protein